MIDGERHARHDVLIIYISSDPDNTARSFAYADEVHYRIGPHDVAIHGILSGEHPLRHTLADDHYRFATAPVVIVEIPARNNGNTEGCEKSGRNYAELRHRIIFMSAFDVAFAAELHPGTK